MAQQSRTLTATKVAYINDRYPSTHYSVSPGTWYPVGNIGGSRQCDMLFALSAWPSSLRHNKLIGAQFRVQLKTDYYSLVTIHANNGTFDANTVTWYTAPEEIDGILESRSWREVAQGDFYVPEEIAGTVNDSLRAHTALASGSLRFTGNTFSYEMQTALSNGSPITARIVYDDAVIVRGNIAYKSGPSSGSVGSNTPTTFAWDYVRESDDAYCAVEEWAQQSATFFWKLSTESSYHSIQISGNTKSVTIPANTFPTGSTVQWYVRGTEEHGKTTQTANFSFSTYATTIVPVTYPSGSNVDNRTAKDFAWYFHTTIGNYPQRSAELLWRKVNTENWNSIPADGATQSLSVPAYTFPAGSTIQWKIAGVDASGVASESQPSTFTTLGYSVTVIASPTGSNIGTVSEIPFIWRLSNTQGDADQRSAVLYWRARGGGAYTAITNSSPTKSIIIPANTFPTSSTIEWYLSVTGADGTVTETAVANFSTVAPKITANTYPSGNSVDFGRGLTFSWYFKTATSNDYPQRSASLFWRASTEDPWSEIPAEGDAKQLTVPAYTFPSDSTISWYLQGTDAGGTTTTTATQSFKTVKPQITPQNSPTSGYADPRNAITFFWFFSTGSSNYPQESADFYWRVAGSEAWNHVAASGTTQSVTIPANTFPRLSNIEWYLTGTDIGGTYSETQVYTFSTTASTARAVCTEPVGKAMDGAKPITLKWIVQNEDGSTATRTIVRWKRPEESQSAWHELLDTTDAVTEYTVPANTFSAGPVDWLVIAYNRDDVAGPESQASFVCILAPDPPSGLSATPVPMTEISWQSTGQEAYEVSIDGVVVKQGFGSDVYSYQTETPLPDGTHSITVRIQGSYGLWSEPAETQIFVTNVPKGSITLTGVFRTDAELFWAYDGEDEPETIAIYRDGKWIGTATGADSFTDRYVLGEHEYIIEYWFEDGYYTRSNTASGTMGCRCPMIAELSGGPWLSLRLSEHETRTQTFTRRRASALTHITARKYPVLELSEQEDLTGDFECAFLDRDEAEAFKRLFGKTVILKSSGGMVIMGGLTETSLTVTRFYSSYTFSIQQIHVEDFVNHDAHD